MTGIFSFLHSGISFTSEITNCNYQAVGWCEKSEVYAGPSVRVSGRWNIELFCCTGSTGLHLCQTLLGAACGQGLGLSFRGLCTGLAEGEWHTGWLSGCISPLMSEGGKSSHSLDHCPSWLISAERDLRAGLVCFLMWTVEVEVLWMLWSVLS